MCVSACLKIFLVVVNLAFLLLGLVLAAAGAILAFFPGVVLDGVYDEVQEEIKNRAPADQFEIFGSSDEISDIPFVYELGVFVLVLGILLAVISFMGVFGPCCMCCKILLLVFGICMGIFLVVEIVSFSLFLTEDSFVHSKIRSNLKDQIPNPWVETDTDSYQQALNLIHSEVGCCGIDGPSDFNVQPKSCTVGKDQGCYSKLQDLISDNVLLIGLGVAAILLLQFLEMIFALYLYKDSNKIFP